MKTKTYLIGIIAIIGLAALIQGASAQFNGGGGFNGSCGALTIESIAITPDEGTANGIQIDPNTPSKCADVVKCDRKPAPQCNCTMGCNMNCIFNGQGIPQAAGTGTHCMGSDGLYKCDYARPANSCADDTCAYDVNGKWVGEWMGGYAYDQNDGYKMGLKTVMVNVRLTVAGGIVQVCNGGHVKIDIDNYDIKGGFIDLPNPPECLAPTGITTAVWKGNFTMHYWEKPGEYIVSAHAITCCNEEKTSYETFEYIEKPLLCIAPQGKLIEYGNKTLCVDTMTEAIGDEIKSNCTQCDIGSKPATIRNVGNAVTNPQIYATDLVCDDTITPGCSGSRISVSHNNTPNAPKYGSIYVDFGNGPVLLWDTKKVENMQAQSYCNKTVQDGCCSTKVVGIFGLPPGPHATNIISLKIDPLPCAPGGYYTQQIFLSGVSVEACCQDHREPIWPKTSTINNCITPPQCYELNRYLNLGVTLSDFVNGVPGVRTACSSVTT